VAGTSILMFRLIVRSVVEMKRSFR
jgi:hypothetical protein